MMTSLLRLTILLVLFSLPNKVTGNSLARQSIARGGAAGGRWAPRNRGFQSQGKHSKQEERYPSVQDLDDEITQKDTKEAIESFLTRDSRNTFIARVYGILSIQLLVTGLSIIFFGTNPSIGAWMRNKGAFVPFLSLGLSTFAWFFVCGSVKARRLSPLKWQLLSLFTLGESITVGFISSLYKFSVVLSAMAATAAAASAVSIYTITNRNAKYDLSQWGAGLSSAGMIFLIYGLIHLLELYGVLPSGFLPYRDAWFSLFGSVLFSFYLAYHTKLIVAGKHTKYQMNEKDYVYGAMSLYNDIINMFIYILRLLGDDDRR